MAIKKGNAFPKALAGESVTDVLKSKYDFKNNTYNGVTHEDLDRLLK